MRVLQKVILDILLSIPSIKLFVFSAVQVHALLLLKSTVLELRVGFLDIHEGTYRNVKRLVWRVPELKNCERRLTRFHLSVKLVFSALKFFPDAPLPDPDFQPAMK